MAEHHPRRILLTGGAGFIGSHLVRNLLRTDPECQVVNLDLLTYAGDLTRLEEAGTDPRLRTVVGDVADGELVRSLLREHRIDSVVHLAAESHVDRSITGPAPFIRTNVVGTFTLLEACREFWLEGSPPPGSLRFHHVSTDEVYGALATGDPPFREESPYAPNSPYSASKAAADHLVRAYHQTYGLPVVTSNSSNNYGAHQHGEKFIPTVVRSCLQQAPIPLYGDGMNVRDWLHVGDHCEGLALVLRKGEVGRTYLLGGEEEWTNRRVAEEICSLFDELRPSGAPHHSLISFVADRPGHDWRYALDSSRAREELGWRPGHSFREGLRETVEWYLRREERGGGAPLPG